jgi:hypothetical protein
MIAFRAVPDRVWLTILNETMDHVVDAYLSSPEPRDQADWLCAALPRSALYFTAAEAKAQLQALQAVLNQEGLHRVSRYHWLLLFESLHTFTQDFNEQPHGVLRTDYGIQRVHVDRLVRVFFPDTTFLDAESAQMVRGQAQPMLIIPASIGALTGFKPHPDELVITPCATQDTPPVSSVTVLRISETGEYPAA